MTQMYLEIYKNYLKERPFTFAKVITHGKQKSGKGRCQENS